MRHVDEGMIHAWLDGQVADPTEAAWLEQHVRACATCAARLAEERATFEHANALLAAGAPAAAPPAFADIRAKAALESRADGNASRPRTWLVQAGWAASLVLAAGIGWLARDMADEDVVAPAAVVATAPMPAEPPTRIGDAVAPRAEARGGGRSGPRVESKSPAAVETDRVRRAESREVEVPQIEPQAVAPPPSTADLATAAPSAAAPLATSAGLTSSAQLGQAAPAAPTPERVGLAGETLPIAAPPPGWMSLARTEAAARSGMALWGIDGVMPLRTAVSADGRVVRTLYRLASGDVVELEQQRLTAPAAPPPSLQEPTPDASGRSRIAANVAMTVPRTWSGVRGDIRLTLRTTSTAPDLDALAASLRVD